MVGDVLDLQHVFVGQDGKANIADDVSFFDSCDFSFHRYQNMMKFFVSPQYNKKKFNMKI